MPGFFAHESSYIDEGALIGDGTKIWHFCHVLPGAVIGERCNLGQNVVVMGGTTLGNNVKVQNNVSIYEGVELEDDVFCGPSCVFTNVTNPRSHVSRKAEYRPHTGAEGQLDRSERHHSLRSDLGGVLLHWSRGGGPERRSRLRLDGGSAGPQGGLDVPVRCPVAAAGWARLLRCLRRHVPGAGGGPASD